MKQLQGTYRENIFTSEEKMEEAVQKHIYHKNIKGTVKKVLICINYYCKLTNGVCKVKADTLAEKSRTSRSTVMRAIKQLIELHVIKKENQTKLNGIKGASVYIILPFVKSLESGDQNEIETTKLTHREQIDTSSLTHRDTSSEVNNTNDSHEIFQTEYIKSFTSFNSFNLFNKHNNTSNNIIYTTYSNSYAKQRNVKNELLNIYNPVSGNDEVLFNQLCKVAFGSLKKYRQMFNLSFDTMADIVVNCMESLMKKEGVDKPDAFYSQMITNQVNNIVGIKCNKPQVVNKPKKQETLLDLAKRSKEKVPDWYFKRDEVQVAEVQVESQAIDFEAERQKILAKLRGETA